MKIYGDQGTFRAKSKLGTPRRGLGGGVNNGGASVMARGPAIVASRTSSANGGASGGRSSGRSTGTVKAPSGASNPDPVRKKLKDAK